MAFSPKECGICLQEFDEFEFCPKILPCSHNMCGKCLDKTIKMKNKCCPFCRRSFQENSLQSFGTNFLLLDALKCLKELEDKQKTIDTNNLDEGFEMITIDSCQNNEDPRDHTVSSHQRNRGEPPRQRGRNELSYQQDTGETSSHEDQSDSPYQRSRDKLLHHRDHSESSHQRYNGEPPHQRDRSETSRQRYSGELLYQRESNESSHQRYSNPPYQRDQSESSYQRNRSKLPCMTNCGGLHHQGTKNAMPCHQYRGGSPDQGNRGRSHDTDNWKKTHHKNPDEDAYWRGRGESSCQTQGTMTHLENRDTSPQQKSRALLQHRDQHRTPYHTTQEFTCFMLLNILINTEDFSTSTQMIIQNHGTEPDDIHRILDDYKHVFEENGGKISFKPEIKICSYHISIEGCHDKSSCSKLHICPNYIFSSCPDENCILGHNIKSSHNQSVLKLFLMHELSAQQLPHILSEVIPQSTSNPTGHHNRQEASNVYEDKVSTSESFQNTPHRTLWHDDYEGNIEIPEICYYSVTNKCRNEVTGCKRLHADAHFHWQVKERGVGWVNLRKTQVEVLEKAYCNPNRDTGIIPPLNKNNCQRRIFSLFGSDKWEVNFKEMSLWNGKTKVKLSLRRITSQQINGNAVAIPKYRWYFQDRNDYWVQYGRTDTTRGSSGVSSITSDEIEREYQKDPSSSITFHIFGTLYILDFNTMVQMNTTTNVRRSVKRRPVYHEKSNSRKKCM